MEECLKLITLSVIANRFAVVAVEIRPPPARTKIGPLACYEQVGGKQKNFTLIILGHNRLKRKLKQSNAKTIAF